MDQPTSERFWSKVDKSGECWVWTGSRLAGGYGHFRIGMKTVIASRYAYEEAYGAVPDDLMVLHRCDNPPCVRPDHLFLGTAADNRRDAVSKGRVRQRGSNELYSTDPEEWRRRVVENFARHEAKRLSLFQSKRRKSK